MVSASLAVPTVFAFQPLGCVTVRMTAQMEAMRGGSYVPITLVLLGDSGKADVFFLLNILVRRCVCIYIYMYAFVYIFVVNI